MINNTELALMVKSGAVTGAIASKVNGRYKLVIETKGEPFLIKTRREDVRLFKALSSAEAFLNIAGINSFNVVG